MGQFPPEIEARKIGRPGARVKGYWESKSRKTVETQHLSVDKRLLIHDQVTETKNNVTKPLSISGHVIEGKLVSRKERFSYETLLTLIALWERFLQKFPSVLPDFATRLFPSTKLPLWVLRWHR